MRSVLFAIGVAVACSRPARPTTPAADDDHGRPDRTEPARPAALQRTQVTLTIVGTNDLHGALERLPMLGGFLANLRAARAADGGGVVVVDGGDMFQGTLESNLGEGADVVRAYNRLGYAAVAVGNHEFDYGPEGPSAIARGPGDDPRGALKARAREAAFPFLATNIVDAATGARIDWPNMPARALIEVAGVKVGIIGASTESTPTTTMPANFAGLAIAAPARAITAQAAELRALGAQVIVAAMHIGAGCKDFAHPDDDASCDKAEELFKLLGELPPGAVDVIVAGHTHAGIAHRLAGVAVIESFASGRAFGRVDLQITDGKVTGVHIDRPRSICKGDVDSLVDERGNAAQRGGGNPVAIAACEPGSYEGRPVVPDPEVQRIVDAAVARAQVRRDEPLGVVLAGVVRRAWAVESPEGNLVTDLMLAARPEAQIAVTNGGGLRADLPAGALSYGALFEALPFDNRFALVDVTGKDVRALVATNLQRGGAILSWGGLTARARCKAGALDLAIAVQGKPLDDAARYKLATSDFLASGGNGVFPPLRLPASAFQITDAIIRDAVADVLRGWKATPREAIDPARLYSAQHPRLDYPGVRPVECAKATGPNRAARGQGSAARSEDKETSP